MADIRKVLHESQWAALDKMIASILREDPVFQILPSVNVGKGRREVDYAKPVDVDYGNDGIDFNYIDRNAIIRDFNSAKITYKTLPVHISEVDLDASGSQGLMSLLAQAEVDVRSKMLEFMAKIIFHGSTKRGSTGMVNFTGVNTSAAAGAWTTVGNFFIDLETAISSIRSAHIMPPYTLIMTPGIPAELRGNNISAAGGYKNEWVAFKDIYMTTKDAALGVIGDLHVSDVIYNGTLAANTQCFALFKNSPDCVYVAESYGLQRARIPRKYWEGDIEYALRWAGGFIPKNPDAVYYVTAGTTATIY